MSIKCEYIEYLEIEIRREMLFKFRGMSAGASEVHILKNYILHTIIVIM